MAANVESISGQTYWKTFQTNMYDLIRKPRWKGTE